MTLQQQQSNHSRAIGNNIVISANYIIYLMMHHVNTFTTCMNLL